MREVRQKVYRVGETNLKKKFLFEVGRQILNHGLLLLALHLQLYFPDELKEVVYSVSDTPLNSFQFHKLIERNNVLHVKDTSLGVGVYDLQEDFARIRSQHHEQYHQHDRV